MSLYNKNILAFTAITLFYFFESGQMPYFNVLAPSFIAKIGYTHAQVATVSAFYYYGVVIGLLPVGYFLDRYPMRTLLLTCLLGTTIGAFLLFVSDNITLQCTARFLCGFFGGTFSFIAGFCVISLLFAKKFALFTGIFLAAGMLGQLACQYPLLLAVQHHSIRFAMQLMFAVGVAVMLFNWVYFQPNWYYWYPVGINITD